MSGKSHTIHTFKLAREAEEEWKKSFGKFTEHIKKGNNA